MDGAQEAHLEGQVAILPPVLFVSNGIESGVEVGVDLQAVASLEAEPVDSPDFHLVGSLSTLPMDLCENRS